MANLRFFITGGPGAGKTTTLEALAEQGSSSHVILWTIPLT
jgi:predicted ATPase